MEYLTVPGLEKWQHYKDRRPPWMKLHIEIFDNYDFSLLPDQTKYHLLGIWLLATQLDNKLPNDEKWIGRKIGAISRIDINNLITLGLLVEHPASALLSKGKQIALGEAETEAETEAEEEGITGKPLSCPQKKIISLYHATLPELPKIRLWEGNRPRLLRERWKDHPDLEEWKSYFKFVRQSKFLMGKVEPMNGRKKFKADLEWLIKSANFQKVVEGKYHDETNRSAYRETDKESRQVSDNWLQ